MDDDVEDVDEQAGPRELKWSPDEIWVPDGYVVSKFAEWWGE